jgi:hypothetical protein
VAIYLVGRVAYPFYGGVPFAHMELEQGARRLRNGIRMTFVAVTVIVAATVSGWWPSKAAAADVSTVEIRDGSGARACGELVEAPAGAVRLRTAGGVVTVRVDSLATIRPVSEC